MAQEPNASHEPPNEGPAEQGGSGFDGPFTKFPHALTDQWMQVLSGDGWKVLSFVARQTFGWHQPTAFISLSDFIEGTGLPTRTVVLRALKQGLAPLVMVRSKNARDLLIAKDQIAKERAVSMRTGKRHETLVKWCNLCRSSLSLDNKPLLEFGARIC